MGRIGECISMTDRGKFSLAFLKHPQKKHSPPDRCFSGESRKDARSPLKDAPSNSELLLFLNLPPFGLVSSAGVGSVTETDEPPPRNGDGTLAAIAATLFSCGGHRGFLVGS